MTRTLAPVALAAVLALGGCAPEHLVTGSGPQDRTAPSAASDSGRSGAAEGGLPATPTPTPSPGAACLATAAGLSLEDRVGQLYMVGVSTDGLDETTRATIAGNRVGSVVLLGNSTAGVQKIRMLTAELGSLGDAAVPLLISVDQEGGSVQRLQGEGFTRIPTAREQGGFPPGQLTTEAAVWGAELRAAGVDYNLAPVGDVVPEDHRDTNAPIGKLRRDFGSDPDQVGAKVQEFIAGMHEADVLTSVKHFPGLGLVENNTDFEAAKDTEIGADSPILTPFRMAIAGAVDSVMVSSAVYTRIDGQHEAMFSSKVIDDLLRGELGYGGVVISDDLGAAVAVKDVEPAQRGVRFISAGGDLAVNADPTLMGKMVEATVELAEDDATFASRVTRSAGRVLELKEKAGLLTCG